MKRVLNCKSDDQEAIPATNWRLFWKLTEATGNIWGWRFNTIRNAALSLGPYSLLVTESEPRRHIANNGAPAFIAFKERAYDVSQSFHWKNGPHQVMHSAGEDLLERVPMVGTLVSSWNTFLSNRSLYYGRVAM